jgi:hypothetical protein
VTDGDGLSDGVGLAEDDALGDKEPLGGDDVGEGEAVADGEPLAGGMVELEGAGLQPARFMSRTALIAAASVVSPGSSRSIEIGTAAVASGDVVGWLVSVGDGGADGITVAWRPGTCALGVGLEHVVMSGD